MRGPLAAVALLAFGCGDEAIDPLSSHGSSARALGIFSSERAQDPIEEARRALARDAYRREFRFIDTALPGFMLEASSPTFAELADATFSPDESYQLGAQLFHYDFTPGDGLGGADTPGIRRFHVGHRGGPDATSCRTCHWRGGIAGGGDAADNAYLQGDGDQQATAFERNPRSLAGAGWIEIAAREMSGELRGQRSALVLRASADGRDARAELKTKGVSFGFLTAHPDGLLDTSELRGIDADLELRPFGWKGSFATLRDAVEDALRVHLGLQSSHLVDSAGDVAATMGPNGGPDPDGDGVVDEISEGQLAALTLFAAMQEAPIAELPNTELAPISLVAAGQTGFAEIGCASCHTPRLALSSSRFELGARDGGSAISVDLLEHGAMPRLTPSSLDGSIGIDAYTDLKRHDLGPELADARADRGVAAELFITPPLWGVMRSRPYLHDGRAQTIHEAIVQHGGEAQAARDAYVALGEAGQAPIRVFIATLTRGPRYVVP